jgi:DNA polymerase V
LFLSFDLRTIIKKRVKLMSRGGSRAGAGRAKGTGKFGEPTKAIRVPASQVEHIYELIENKFHKFPLYESAVSAGFPSPAEHEIEQELDLNELLVKHPAATFFVRVSGTSMINAGIHDGDILVVDRSLTAVHGKVVIAAVNGELTVKRFWRDGDRLFLRPENKDYRPIEITEGTGFQIWGVVTTVLHSL